jgi:hypothetical protein
MSQTLIPVIGTAAAQYANRPPDERYPSLQAMIDAAHHEREHSIERAYNLRDLRIEPADADLMLVSPKGIAASFSHWSFGQLCRTLGAPAGYLREKLTPGLAADCLNHGMTSAPHGTAVNLLVKQQNGGPPRVRACTSDSYGRVWDAALYSQIAETLTRQDSRWQLPPTWTGEAAGAYRGDRDSFLILVNGGSIVNDPSAGSSGEMHRGLLVRNSEVGAAAIVIERILYRYVCGNHNLWGAVIDRTFKRRHVGDKITRETTQEIARLSREWAQASASRDEAIIKALIAGEVAHTKDGVIDELRAIGMTREQAESAYQRTEATEAAGPRSWWGLANGITRLSQDSGYQDDRYALDRFAMSLMAKGAKKVAAA